MSPNPPLFSVSLMRALWLPIRIFWGLLCLGTALSAFADTPLPWGLRVFSQESERLPPPLALSPDVLVQLDTASERIATIEGLRGPYSADLTDPLLETAHIAAEYGEVDRAIEHEVRPGDGLRERFPGKAGQGFQRERRVLCGEARFGRDAFFLSKVRFAIEHLPGQVGKVDGVVVREK